MENHSQISVRTLYWSLTLFRWLIESHSYQIEPCHFRWPWWLWKVDQKKKISHGQLATPLSRWGLNPIKPVYDPDQPDGWLSLTTSALSQLGQYTSTRRWQFSIDQTGQSVA